jgi:hypothetical protein
MESVQGSGSQPEFAHGVWLVYSTKLTLSRDDVVVKSRGAWCGGYTEFVGFAVVHHKSVRFLGCSAKPRPKDRQAEMGSEHAGKLRGRGHVTWSWGLRRMEARLWQRRVRQMGISTS